MKQCKMSLAQGKESTNSKPGYCSVHIQKNKQKQLEPALQGPFEAANYQSNDQADTNRELIQVSSMPLCYLKVSQNAVQLLMSFNAPELRFKTEVKYEEDDTFTLALINSHTLPSLAENRNLIDRNQVIVAPCGEDNAYQLNICSKSNGSHLFKLDLSFLEAMKDDLA